MTRRSTHRHVPTLTEVVQPAAPAAPEAAAAPAPAISQEEVVRQVMQRVDAMLERRLREAIAAAVVEQAQALAPLLRGEIESSVRQAVAQALEPDTGRAPPGR